MMADKTRRSIDPIIGVQLYVIALLGSPSAYVVKPLGAAGTPATIVGLALLIVWLVLRAAKRLAIAPIKSVQIAVGVFGCGILIAFAAGMLRPISGPEMSSSVRGLILVASWCGVILFTADAARSADVLAKLTRTISFAGGVLAALGIIQFFTQIDYVQLLHLPGLVQNSDPGGVYVRSGFNRVSGTAIHSIEFAAVLSACLPIALHLALTHEKKHLGPNWVASILMFVAITMTVSRSGAIGLGIALIAAFLIANRRQRWLLLVMIPIGVIVLRALIPGLLGTILSLFYEAPQDPSIGGRLADYSAVRYYVAQSPLVGRGIFTFIPEMYRILDNQYLGILVEGGIIGLTAFVVLLGVPLFLSIRGGLTYLNRADRSLSMSMAATLVSIVTLASTFDLFGFQMAVGMTYVVIGLIAGLDAQSRPRSNSQQRGRISSRRRWGISIGAAGLVIVLPISIASIEARSVFEAQESMTVALGPLPGQNIYDYRVATPPTAEIVVFIMRSERTRKELAASGVTSYELAFGRGSLAPLTEVDGAGDSEMIRVAARGESPAAARGNAIMVRHHLEGVLRNLQQTYDVDFTDAPVIGVHDVFLEPEVFEIGVRRQAGILAGVLAGAILAALFSQLPIVRFLGLNPTQQSRHARRSAVK